MTWMPAALLLMPPWQLPG